MGMNIINRCCGHGLVHALRQRRPPSACSRCTHPKKATGGKTLAATEFSAPPRFLTVPSVNRAVVGQPSRLPVLRASLPAEHLGGRDAARTGRLEACPTLEPAGSWPQGTSKIWKCSLSMNLTLVGTSRCDVPDRKSAGGIVVPLNATRTAQRAVPTRLRGSMREDLLGRNLFMNRVAAGILP